MTDQQGSSNVDYSKGPSSRSEDKPVVTVSDESNCNSRICDQSEIDMNIGGTTEVGPFGLSGLLELSDISLGMGTPPVSPIQHSPMFWCRSNSLRSTQLPAPSSSASFLSDRNSRDVIEHPIAGELVINDGVSIDETDVNIARNPAPQDTEYFPKPQKDGIIDAPMPVGPDADEYPMAYNSRIAVIFLNDSFESEERRRGSQQDVIKLEESLIHLEFNVDVHRNFTRRQIADELDRLLAIGFENCDCFWMVVMTHGEAPELLHAKDGIYPQRDLWMPFADDKCPSLAGKPKLFFIQACRGTNTNKGIRLVKYSNTSETDTEASRSYVIPFFADILIAHCTLEGFYGWRDVMKGSWWIQILCQELMSRGSTQDLLKILTVVNRRVAIEEESRLVVGRPDLSGAKQMPCFMSTLMRDLYFRPKIKATSQQTL